MGCYSNVNCGEKTRIIGILLVRNEDLFIDRIIQNIVRFCDEIIVADNLSNDKTSLIVQSLGKRFSKIRYVSIDHPSKSHELIKEYISQPAWVFAVDGDELYDPQGLAILRNKIILGHFSDSWMLFGNVMNCTDIDQVTGLAKGYLSPPSRSMTKLYNFSLISDWSGDCPERLHGGQIAFKNEESALRRLELHEKYSWDESYFRCLHLCFLRRSSNEKPAKENLVVRKNISDINNEGIIKKALMASASFLGFKQDSAWKNEKYMRGMLVKKDVSAFFLDASSLSG